MAKRAAKAAVQEAIATEAKELAVQGEWFRLSAKAKSDGQWGQVVKRMKEETREWCTKAALRILPDATNKKRWGWNVSEELKCKCGKPATDAHVLNGCELALPRYTWRHNGVLCGLRGSFRKAANEEWSIYADVDNTTEDPHSQRWFTANGVCTKLRPDMLLVKEKDGEVVRVIVLELSCVWEAESDESFVGAKDDWALRAKKAGWKWTTTIEKRRAAKRFKYSEELMNALPWEWNAQLATVEIGSRGFVAPETKADIHNVFRTLGCQKQAKLQAERCIAEARRRAMLGSYLIWSQRDREDWDMHETVGAWRGKTEVENLLSRTVCSKERNAKKQLGREAGLM